jgi:hypothetical protein
MNEEKRDEYFDLKLVAYKVLSLLTDNPECRDNDRLLIAEIWSKETKSTTVQEFLLELIQGNLSNCESIRRMRQKIQERHPYLRGEKWDIRHKMEGAICQQLSFFDKW